MYSDELRLIQATCHFIEAVYDPFLTWRSYLQNHPADFTKINYNVNPLHAEIVPFIYCE